MVNRFQLLQAQNVVRAVRMEKATCVTKLSRCRNVSASSGARHWGVALAAGVPYARSAELGRTCRPQLYYYSSPSAGGRACQVANRRPRQAPRSGEYLHVLRRIHARRPANHAAQIYSVSCRCVGKDQGRCGAWGWKERWCEVRSAIE